MSGIPLADRGAIAAHTVRDNIFDLQADYLAAVQLLPMAGLNMTKARVRFSTEA